MPLAQGFFSTAIVTPRISDKRLAMTREVLSFTPQGGKKTIQLIGLVCRSPIDRPLSGEHDNFEAVRLTGAA
jgi:hypothetical protein